jgi:hypothetical protein
MPFAREEVTVMAQVTPVTGPFPIDYRRAGLLEAAIREAAREYGFRVLEIRLGSDHDGPPWMTIELRQIEEVK